MYHEKLKEWILFSSPESSRWFYELPVVLGAVMGAIVAFVMWQNSPNTMSRILVVVAVAFGCASVAIDVFAAGVLWEECCKLAGEMLVASALIVTVAPPVKVN
jgi:hypothetical protein